MLPGFQCLSGNSWLSQLTIEESNRNTLWQMDIGNCRTKCKLLSTASWGAVQFCTAPHLDILLPLLTTICNRSIVEGVMPFDQKRSILVPVIKRAGLDTTDPGNFRPIANVSFISKVIEKIIAYQPVPYLEANNLIPAIQSGIRTGHSTETLLLCLLSDIYGAIDRSQLTFAGTFRR